MVDGTSESNKTLDSSVHDSQTTSPNQGREQQQQQPPQPPPPRKPTRFKRPISQKACETCRKRRVRCNATARNWPEQKCTNCEEFGVECVVLKKKKKRSKEEIEADNLRNQQLGQQQGQDGNPTVGFSFKIETPDKVNKKQKVKKTASTNTKESKKSIRRLENVEQSTKIKQEPPTIPQPVKEQHIIIDPESILNRQLDPSCQAVILRGYSQKPELMKMLDFEKIMPQRFTMRDTITPEQLKLFKILHCFVLPDEATCRKYIDNYFEYHESSYPVLSRIQFEKDFKDLRNPPSLLFLWTMFVV
ncbi:unnamed protein product [Ambrosiozyma monospora]|uniref:Unnamed protein product n=1 Tax=Ambrosiozyma monospora TaxID=43982 RepID=A0ACB5T4R0_AMBMO|nr:unnamed protein product [Ambrosiozyma monospora]